MIDKFKKEEAEILKEKKLRIWWIPQVPMESFYHPVSSVLEGKRVLECLALYDLFQLENNIKPDFSNAGGLQVFEDGEWIDWESEDGEGIDDFNYEELKSYCEEKIK